MYWLTLRGNERLGYYWQCFQILHFLFSFEEGQLTAGPLLKGLLITVKITTISLVFAVIAGQFISTIKDSAIVSVISIQELTFQGMELMSATYLTFEIWITIALMYLVLSISLSSLIGRLEVYMRKRTTY